MIQHLEVKSVKRNIIMINLVLTDSNQKDFEKATTEEMDKALKHFERELITIRTGRAHPALVENIVVSCYGGTTTLPIKQIAAIAAPDVNLITIEPWDKAIIPDMEKAIANSNLGVSAENDGNIIRLRLPQMSAERRGELVKILHKKLEETKVSIRNIRKDFQNLVRDSAKDKNISEDHSRRLADVLQKITDKFCTMCDDLSAKKEKDLAF